MSFRDHQQAIHEREKAELRDKLAQEKAENDRLEREVAELRRKTSSNPVKSSEDDDEFQAELRKMGVKAPRRTAVGNVMDSITNVLFFPFRLIGHMLVGIAQVFSAIPLQGWLIGGFFTIFVGVCVYHEFYDIRDGYITGKNYTPGHWEESCSTDSQGNRSCSSHYVQPQWDVTITFEGSSATWGVNEAEYERLRYGQWFCARDFLHEAPCVQDRPAEF